MSSLLTPRCTAPRANQVPAVLGVAGLSAMRAWYGAGVGSAAALGNQVKDASFCEGIQRTPVFEPRKRRE